MVDTLDGFAKHLRELRKQLLDAFPVKKQLQTMAR